MITINTNAFGLTTEFRGSYAPFQSIHLEPHPRGGVLAMATRHGHSACIALDPNGFADEARTILPSDDLLKAARALKAGNRYITLDQAIATVTTQYSGSRKSTLHHVTDSSKEFPSLRSVIQGCIQRWSTTPESSATAGRYDSELLLHAIKAAAGSPSLVLTGFDGGPLRLQSESLQAVILVMPQTAEPIPAIPEWLVAYANDISLG